MFMKKHPQLYAVVEEVGAELVDLSVAKLVEQISRGEFQAIRYFLDNRGDAAGFGNMKRYQISGPNGGPIKVESKPKGPDLSKLSMTELEALESLLAKAGPIGDDAPGD